jgi:hypothetical protein
MRLRISAAVIACAFVALSISAAEARTVHQQPHAPVRLACKPIFDNSGHVRCAEAETRPVRSAALLDANGNRVDRREASIGAARGYCQPVTAAGRIIIACDLVDRMKGFIGDVVARGFRGRVHCFSLSHSHVPRSLHFIGEACDFAFRDCGHIDSGRAIARRGGDTLSARRHRTRR